MKNRSKLTRALWRPGHVASLFVALVLNAGAETITYDLNNCKGLKLWPANYFDKDGDGYAVAEVDPNWRLCYGENSEAVVPDGYIEKRGDLDDNDPDVHPRRREVYGNGIDDDCDGSIDEPEFEYHPQGNENTTDGFTMDIRINDPAVVEAWQYRGRLKLFRYAVEYQALTDTSPAGTRNTGYQSLTVMSTSYNYALAQIRLSGLQSGLVIRARVQFYAGPAWNLQPVGAVSDWYYTTTDHDSDVGRAQTRIILRGLYEYYASQIGLVGYAGTTYPYGQRYGGSEGEAWCSEFYSWVVDPEVSEMGERHSVSKLQEYFQKAGAYKVIGTAADQDEFIRKAHRGAYLAYDGNTGEDPFHSAMFLAYDQYTQKCWTLNGNSTSAPTEYLYGGDEVAFQEFNPSDFAGWGQITGGMLK